MHYIHQLMIHHLSIGGWFKRMELIEVKRLIWAQKGKLYIIYENVMWIFFNFIILWKKLKFFEKYEIVCNWCVPSASDVFLSKNGNYGGKTREASEGMEYDIYFTGYDFCPVWSRVLIFTHCPIKLIYWWLLIYEV